MTGWLRGVFGADDAADAATEAANVQAGAQTEALDYLREREAIPTGIRDEALQGLGGYYQVPDQQMTQGQLIEQAMASPLYKAIMDTRDAGNEAILKTASATGGLRSGGSQKDIYDYNLDLSNKALLTSFNQAQQRQDAERLLNLQGLGGLAGINTNEGAIANMMSGIGATKAAGITGAAQAKAQGTNNALDTILGAGQALATVFSDIRLKEDIRFLGRSHGINWYGWTWNEHAKELGLEGECSGVLAHEAYEIYPNAVSEKDGFLQINYSKIGSIH